MSHNITDVFSEWNPLEVPEDLVEDEYRQYIEELSSLRADKAIIREKLHQYSDMMGLADCLDNDLFISDLFITLFIDTLYVLIILDEGCISL